MDLAGDLDGLLADFGVTVTAGGASFLGILNSPDQVVGDLAISTDYSITAKTSDLSGLDYGEAVVVSGVNYSVRKNMKLDDGLMSMVTLTKE